VPESVTVKVSGVLLAVTVGVPVIAPVAAFKERTAGRAPLVRDQVKGVVPPVAFKAAL
jgi:hypothetical protein